MHAWKYLGNKEKGCWMGKESKLGTNEEVWLDTSGWTTSERVDLQFLLCYWFTKLQKWQINLRTKGIAWIL
jgi:hypothetical protein